MSLFALLSGKTIASLASFSGGGSSIPGKVVLDLDADILSKFTYPERVIFVTGTNGKTSTTRYLSEIFQDAGYTVLTNAAGANLEQGIVTQVVKESNLKFEIQADVAVFEVDEATLPVVIHKVKPTAIVMTNLFPDQVDRFGSVEALSDLISESLTSTPTLILNGNDPRLVKLAEVHDNNESLFYGLEKKDFDQPAHPIDCPICQHPLTYSHHHYEHIGWFECPECGLRTPEDSLLASDLNFDQENFKVQDQTYHMAQANLYSVFNQMAAITCALHYGLSPQSIQKTMAKGIHIKGRNDKLQIKDQEIPINLAKNAAGMNQTIVSIQPDKPFNVLLAVNNKGADGLSTAWLHDCEFERLNQPELKTIYVSGLAHKELEQILLEKGFDSSQISVLKLSHGLEKLLESPAENYIIANYTALNDVYQVAEKL